MLNIFYEIFYQSRIQRASSQYKEGFDIVSGNENKRSVKPRWPQRATSSKTINLEREIYFVFPQYAKYEKN
jgi:hypothetical protein